MRERSRLQRMAASLPPELARGQTPQLGIHGRKQLVGRVPASLRPGGPRIVDIRRTSVIHATSVSPPTERSAIALISTARSVAKSGREVTSLPVPAGAAGWRRHPIETRPRSHHVPTISRGGLKSCARSSPSSSSHCSWRGLVRKARPCSHQNSCWWLLVLRGSVTGRYIHRWLLRALALSWIRADAPSGRFLQPKSGIATEHADHDAG